MHARSTRAHARARAQAEGRCPIEFEKVVAGTDEGPLPSCRFDAAKQELPESLTGTYSSSSLRLWVLAFVEQDDQETRMDHFDHDKVDVYHCAIDFVAVADDIVENLPRGRAYLADQLHRASLSISLNVAEGAGEFATKEKARFYRIAKRSATECAAAIDVCLKLKFVDPGKLNEARGQLLRIVSMLTKMCK